MKTFKIIVNSYINKKTNQSFLKMTCKGQYLPLLKANKETYYNVHFTKVGDDVLLPKKEGIYGVAVADKGIWIDDRAEMKDKNIVRCIPLKIVFEGELNKERRENEIRLEEPSI